MSMSELENSLKMIAHRLFWISDWNLDLCEQRGFKKPNPWDASLVRTDRSDPWYCSSYFHSRSIIALEQAAWKGGPGGKGQIMVWEGEKYTHPNHLLAVLKTLEHACQVGWEFIRRWSFNWSDQLDRLLGDIEEHLRKILRFYVRAHLGEFLRVWLGRDDPHDGKRRELISLELSVDLLDEARRDRIPESCFQHILAAILRLRSLEEKWPFPKDTEEP